MGGGLATLGYLGHTRTPRLLAPATVAHPNQRGGGSEGSTMIRLFVFLAAVRLGVPTKNQNRLVARFVSFCELANLFWFLAL